MKKVELNKNLIFKNKNRFAEEFEKAKELPAFDTIEEAKIFWIKQKEEGLKLFEEFLVKNDFFEPTYDPESLKLLELLYFDLYENMKFEPNLIERAEFELLMNLYWGETLVRNSERMEWEAQKHFLAENAYYLAVGRKQLSMAISRLTDYYGTRSNKTKRSLFRKFKSYVE